jgi:hypothetical protein
MTWELVFDRIGGLWAGVAAFVGFWIANQFELRCDARQAERDQDRESRNSQRSDINELQQALQRLMDATGHATMMFTQWRLFNRSGSRDAPLEEPWYQEWTSSVQSVLVLTTHVESEALVAIIEKILVQARPMIASPREITDPNNVQQAVGKFSSLNTELVLPTREAQALAGQIYRDLGRSFTDSEHRSWLCKRLCSRS